MKKVAIRINTTALGDTISSIPTLNKLAKSYEQPLTVFTTIPSLFKNHPSVFEVKDIKDDTSGYVLHELIRFKDNPNTGDFKMHNMIDIRQFSAWDIGISLTTDELECDIYCEEEYPIGVEDYVIIHPSITWNSRSWSGGSWQALADQLIGLNIPVVIVGNDNNQSSSEWNYDSQKYISKDIHNIEGGINLINKTTIPQLRWMMSNQALCVVTMDSGILHLAGTTDCNIIQLGSSINHKLRAPWRKGSQDYKYQYVGGDCKIACGSNLKYHLKEWGVIRGVPPIENCLENYPQFECHPQVENVLNSIRGVKNENSIKI
tara:strand:+ start:170 stop:1123 length:954 start_codon:yes stop_codon:yes gene_type:complete